MAHRPDDAGEPAGPIDPQDPFVGALAGFAGRLAPHDAAGSRCGTDLLDGPLLDRLLARFLHAQGAADRRAAASLWSQIYFSTLIIPAAALIVAGREDLRLGLADVRISLCADSGVPLVFHLRPAQDADAAPWASMFDRHVAPLVKRLSASSGVSSRLLWENAGWCLVWALREAGVARPHRGPAIRSWLCDRSWPAGPCHPLPRMKAAALQGGPVGRRICCLRYRLPEHGHCPDICPLIGRGPQAPP